MKNKKKMATPTAADRLAARVVRIKLRIKKRPEADRLARLQARLKIVQERLFEAKVLARAEKAA